MMLVVAADAPWHTLEDLVAAARKAPGTINYASVGIGTTTHLPAEMFAQNAGVQLQMIPYKASALALPDVASGRVSFILGAASTVSELVKAGKLRALATTAEARLPAFPAVPTFIERGHKDLSYYQWLGLFAPARTPPEILQALSAAVEEAKRDPEMPRRLEAQGAEISAPTNVAQFNAFLQREESVVRRVVQQAGLEAAAR